MVGLLPDCAIYGATVTLMEQRLPKTPKWQSSGSAEGLYIGAGKNLETGSLFSGLIDDVRIYDVAMREAYIQYRNKKIQE